MRLLHELQVHHIELQIQNEERESARQLAEEARDRHLRLFSLAPVGVLGLRRDGTVVEANAAAAAMLQMSRDQLLTSCMLDVVAAGSWADLALLIANTDIDNRPQADLSMIDANRRALRVQAVTAVDPDTQQVLRR